MKESQSTILLPAGNDTPLTVVQLGVSAQTSPTLLATLPGQSLKHLLAVLWHRSPACNIDLQSQT